MQYLTPKKGHNPDRSRMYTQRSVHRKKGHKKDKEKKKARYHNKGLSQNDGPKRSKEKMRGGVDCKNSRDLPNDRKKREIIMKRI